MQTTQEMVRRACTGIEAVSLAVNVFILGTSLWVRTVPTAKHHTQRVSYTIIMWAVAMQMGYDIDRLILYSGVSLLSHSFCAGSEPVLITL
jgi:hypothetical protein